MSEISLSGKPDTSGLPKEKIVGMTIPTFIFLATKIYKMKDLKPIVEAVKQNIFKSLTSKELREIILKAYQKKNVEEFKQLKEYEIITEIFGKIIWE